MIIRFIAVAFVLVATNVSAATFDFTSGASGNTFTKSDDGLTAVFTVMQSGAPGAAAPGGSFTPTSLGFAFGAGHVLEFAMTVTVTARLARMDGLVLGDDTFNITGPGVDSVGNRLGEAMVGDPLILRKGAVYMFSTLPAVAGQGSIVSSMTLVSTPIPAAFVMALSGAGVLAGLARLRRSRTQPLA